MKDLRDQLVARFGAPSTPEAPQDTSAAEKPGTLPPELGPQAHLGSDWLKLLRTLAPPLGRPVKSDVSLEAARQLTDHTLKALKAAGRSRERSELDGLRADYLKRREALAWRCLKDQFTAHSLSDKAYRALKQEGVDPAKALR